MRRLKRSNSDTAGKSISDNYLGCHHETLALGMAALDDETALEQGRIRQVGGGRQSAFDPIDGLDAAFLRVLEQHTTDSPIDETVKWTHLKRHAIGALLREAGIEVSVTVIAQLLEQHNFRKRKAVKTLATGESEHRNEQFERSEQLKGTYQAASNSIMSMDTKKEK